MNCSPNLHDKEDSTSVYSHTPTKALSQVIDHEGHLPARLSRARRQIAEPARGSVISFHNYPFTAPAVNPEMM